MFRALVLLPCALLLMGFGSCSEDRPVVVKLQPGAGLLQPCQDPALAAEPATDNDLAAERIRVAQAYLDCKQRQADLAKWVRG